MHERIGRAVGTTGDGGLGPPEAAEGEAGRPRTGAGRRRVTAVAASVIRTSRESSRRTAGTILLPAILLCGRHPKRRPAQSGRAGMSPTRRIVMPTRNAEAVWEGDLKSGKGTMTLGSGAYKGAYSFQSRFESGTGTNPEELIAAAHAGLLLDGPVARPGPGRAPAEAGPHDGQGSPGKDGRRVRHPADRPGLRGRGAGHGRGGVSASRPSRRRRGARCRRCWPGPRSRSTRSWSGNNAAAPPSMFGGAVPNCEPDYPCLRTQSPS